MGSYFRFAGVRIGVEVVKSYFLQILFECLELVIVITDKTTLLITSLLKERRKHSKCAILIFQSRKRVKW